MANETTDGVLRLTKEQARLKIAELRGWTRCGQPTEGKEGWLPRGWQGEGRRKAILPNWPADIAAAWPLLEEMEESFYGLYRSEAGWQVNYFDRDVPTSNLRETEWQFTAPLAICVAYLSWKLNTAVEVVDETEKNDAD